MDKAPFALFLSIEHTRNTRLCRLPLDLYHTSSGHSIPYSSEISFIAQAKRTICRTEVLASSSAMPPLSAIKYKPAPGRDESIVLNECGFATIETAFGGLSGFHVRIIRRFGPTTSITDHVWPWPLYLWDSAVNKLRVIEKEGTGAFSLCEASLSALGDRLDQVSQLPNCA